LLLRAAGRGGQQAGREKNERPGEKYCGLLASPIHLSSPDDAALKELRAARGV